MAHSYALPGERFSSGLTWRWLAACTVSQLICLAALAGGGMLAQRMQWLTGSPEKIALDLVIAAVFALTYGYLRGRVLRNGLARFPMRLWCVAVAAVALIITPPHPTALLDITIASPAPVLLRALSPVVIDGLIYGLLIGSVEALVMRRAAFGLVLWALLSTFAWSLAFVMSTLGLTLTSAWLMPKLGHDITTALWALVMAPLVALLMLPALHGLTPQLSYYGRRVYRPLLRR